MVRAERWIRPYHTIHAGKISRAGWSIIPRNVRDGTLLQVLTVKDELELEQSQSIAEQTITLQGAGQIICRYCALAQKLPANDRLNALRQAERAGWLFLKTADGEKAVCPACRADPKASRRTTGNPSLLVLTIRKVRLGSIVKPKLTGLKATLKWLFAIWTLLLSMWKPVQWIYGFLSGHHLTDRSFGQFWLTLCFAIGKDSFFLILYPICGALAGVIFTLVVFLPISAIDETFDTDGSSGAVITVFALVGLTIALAQLDMSQSPVSAVHFILVVLGALILGIPYCLVFFLLKSWWEERTSKDEPNPDGQGTNAGS